MGEAVTVESSWGIGPVFLKQDLEGMIPHRGRMLLLDTVAIITGGIGKDDQEKRAHGLLLIKEDHCEGHYPNHPVFRAADILDVCCQTLAVLAYHYEERKEELRSNPPMFRSVGKFKVKREVNPGQRIVCQIHIDEYQELKDLELVAASGEVFVLCDGGLSLVAIIEEMIGFAPKNPEAD